MVLVGGEVGGVVARWCTFWPGLSRGGVIGWRVAAEMLSAWLDNGLRMVYGRGVELNG